MGGEGFPTTATGSQTPRGLSTSGDGDVKLPARGLRLRHFIALESGWKIWHVQDHILHV